MTIKKPHLVHFLADCKEPETHDNYVKVHSCVYVYVCMNTSYSYSCAQRVWQKYCFVIIDTDYL